MPYRPARRRLSSCRCGDAETVGSAALARAEAAGQKNVLAEVCSSRSVTSAVCTAQTRRAHMRFLRPWPPYLRMSMHSMHRPQFGWARHSKHPADPAHPCGTDGGRSTLARRCASVAPHRRHQTGGVDRPPRPWQVSWVAVTTKLTSSAAACSSLARSLRRDTGLRGLRGLSGLPGAERLARPEGFVPGLEGLERLEGLEGLAVIEGLGGLHGRGIAEESIALAPNSASR